MSGPHSNIMLTGEARAKETVISVKISNGKNRKFNFIAKNISKTNAVFQIYA